MVPMLASVRGSSSATGVEIPPDAWVADGTKIPSPKQPANDP